MHQLEVSVVFVDMTGSTELASQVDPERFREILAAFHGMVAEEAAWYGGVAERFIGSWRRVAPCQLRAV